MIDIQNWMRVYQKEICSHFGARVIFIGLQGSYARKEASYNSDIDVVLILDKVAMDDLIIYRKLVEQLPHRELLCGSFPAKMNLPTGANRIYSNFILTQSPYKAVLTLFYPHLQRKTPSKLLWLALAIYTMLAATIFCTRRTSIR